MKLAQRDVYAVIDDVLSPDFPLGVELEVLMRRGDAERVRVCNSANSPGS